MITFGVLGVLFTIPIFNGLQVQPAAQQPAFMLCMSGMVIVTGYAAINAVVMKRELFQRILRTLRVALPLCNCQYLSLVVQQTPVALSF